MLKNYDPNLHCGIHVVQVTFMQWGHSGHIAYHIGGNCRGFSLLSGDLETLLDDQDFLDTLEVNDCSLRYDEENACFSLSLPDDKGEHLIVDADLDELLDMVVAIEFIDHRPDPTAKGKPWNRYTEDSEETGKDESEDEDEDEDEE